MSEPIPACLDELARRLCSARRAAALTGAGVSAESGVPTFRGQSGLWRQRNPLQLATADSFSNDPELVWDFYLDRRRTIQAAQPNRAHAALAELERRLPQFTLITQNVDGLHQAAGSQRVLELHGNLWRTRCTGCGRVAELCFLERQGVPACPECGAALRPDVVWFGEALSEQVWQSALAAAIKSDVFLVAGTSGLVQPAASLALAAREAGAWVAEFNLEPTQHSDSFHCTVTGQAGELLPLLVERMDVLRAEDGCPSRKS